jgi:hypothetical protein
VEGLFGPLERVGKWGSHGMNQLSQSNAK